MKETEGRNERSSSAVRIRTELNWPEAFAMATFLWKYGWLFRFPKTKN